MWTYILINFARNGGVASEGCRGLFRGFRAVCRRFHRWDVMQLQLLRDPALRDPAFEPRPRDCFGAMQVSCAYLSSDLPVPVGFNGEISLLDTDGRVIVKS